MCARVGNQRSRGVVTARVRSDAVRSLRHQREISTNRLTRTSQKIGTHPTIKWYQILGFPWGILVCLLVCFLFSYRDPPKKPKKNSYLPLSYNLSSLVTLLSLCPSWLSLVASYICALSFSILLHALFVPLNNSTVPNNKPIHHINRFAFASRLAWTLASPTLESF
jgi:hypothetical protein